MTSAPTSRFANPTDRGRSTNDDDQRQDPRSTDYDHRPTEGRLMPRYNCPGCNSSFTEKAAPSKDLRRCKSCGETATAEAMMDHKPWGRS